ncbi:hypothetical protein [Capsulimonas corticalis]|uniref:hypothetical protein n=1 Tax=Capsulimonas corticalis TaxID=2219043 RepID=UPI000E6551DE|nr:hypothetical protein [Capsulimonas corticalis]
MRDNDHESQLRIEVESGGVVSNVRQEATHIGIQHIHNVQAPAPEFHASSRSDQIVDWLPNFVRANLPYISRGSSNISEHFASLLERRRIVILGRTGLGKTREALELIDKLRQKLGEAPTVLILRQFETSIAKYLADHGHTRNVVWLVDDLHLYSMRYQRLVAMGQAQSTFNDWFNSWLNGLETATAGQTWVICTMRIEPDFLSILDLGREPWTTFDHIQLRNVDGDCIRYAASSLAHSHDLTITDEALDLVAQRSDGTVMGVVAYLKRMSTRKGLKTIDASSMSDYTGTYPLEWKDVYNRYIARYRYRRAVFYAISLLRQINLTPWTELVVVLAAAIAGGRVNWNRFWIRRAINELSPWVELNIVKESSPAPPAMHKSLIFRLPSTAAFLTCPDGYVQDLVSVDDPKYHDTVATLVAYYYFMHQRFDQYCPDPDGRILNEMEQAVQLMAPKSLDSLVSRLYVPWSEASLGGVLFFLAQMRRNDILPFLRYHNRAFDHPRYREWQSYRGNLAYCLGMLGCSEGLPLLLTIIDQLSPSTDRGDAMSFLGSFQGRRDFAAILDHVRTWDRDELDILAYCVLAGISLAIVLSDEEAAERDAYWEDLKDDARCRSAEHFMNSGLVRRRFRGHFAAALRREADTDHYARGLRDNDATIRGATLMLLGTFGTPSLAENDKLEQLLDICCADPATYDGLMIKQIAHGCLEQLRSRSQAQIL